jgi:signal transduction histidine kinase
MTEVGAAAPSALRSRQGRVSTELRQLRLHRTLMLSISAVYLVWWVFVRLSLPDAFNPFGGRLLAVVPFFVLYGASFRSELVARHLDVALSVCCSIATAHYFYLFDRNGADLNWLVGSYITVTAVCAVLQTSRAMLLYSAFVAAVSVFMLQRPAGSTYVVFLPGMFTNLLLFNLGLQARLKLVARLEASNAVAERELGERKRAQAELVRTNRELESFSYSVAHDLRTPLRGMSGFAEVLVEDYGDKLDDEGKSYLARITAAAETMGGLIDALLGLARLTRKEIRREEVDLSTIAKSALDQLVANHPERAVEARVEPGMVAQGDPNLLRLLFDNLIGNAWKFTAKQEPAKIEVGMSERDGAPAFFVKDNGAGFDMSHAAKLFAAFQRLHSADEYPGTGIGLATVQRIVERHGGRVWAEGVVGEGATFCFTLEAARTSAAGYAESS